MRRRLYVIGCARSGTTLLSELLSRHRAVSIAPETKFFQRVWSQRHLLRLLPEAERRRRITAGLVASEYSTQERTFHRKAALFDAALERSGGDLLAAFDAILEALSDAPVVGEKTPWHTFFVRELLARDAPAKQVVAVCRDAPAVTASLLRRPGFRRVETLPRCVARWLLANREILRLAGRVPRERFRLVRFEDLVAAPEPTLRGLCEWAGLAFEPRMLEPVGQDSSLAAAPAAPGLDAGTLERFRERLSAAEVERIEALTAPLAARLGYARRGGAAPAGDRLRCALECALQAAGIRAMRSGLYPFGVWRAGPQPLRAAS